MNALRKMKALVLVVAVMAIIAGGLMASFSQPAQAARCCWVMVCTTEPPIVCWEECVPCPTFP